MSVCVVPFKLKEPESSALVSLIHYPLSFHNQMLWCFCSLALESRAGGLVWVWDPPLLLRYPSLWFLISVLWVQDLPLLCLCPSYLFWWSANLQVVLMMVFQKLRCNFDVVWEGGEHTIYILYSLKWKYSTFYFNENIRQIIVVLRRYF